MLKNERGITVNFEHCLQIFGKSLVPRWRRRGAVNVEQVLCSVKMEQIPTRNMALPCGLVTETLWSLCYS